MFSVSRICLFGLWLIMLAGVASAAENAASRPLLSPMFGDHMVLQRGKPNTFWGWSAPGRTVRVTIGDSVAETTAGTDGRWQTTINLPARGPFEVTVEAGERVVLKDVLVGDVWLCSGQSNMAWALRSSDGGPDEAARANHPDLRFYVVPTHVAYSPAENVAGKWQVCTPESAAGFSAVAYFFARKLQAELGVPIGLVQSAVGGSPAESWMSGESLARIGEFGPQLAEIARLHQQGGAEHGSFLMHWLDEHDVGGRGEAWARAEFDDRSWKSVTVPGGFAELGLAATPAIVWFRREITLPDPLPAGPAKILLGVIERMDTVYVNGRWTGASSWVENPRAYTISADALKPGRNVIAVRVFKTKPDGGFMSSAERLRLQLGDGREVPLAGEWKAALSFDARPPAPMPLDFENYPTMPTVLYNGMLAPVAPLAIAGAIWYQGEANAWRPAAQYRKLLPALVADWRTQFGQGEFPFYVVGLPVYLPRKAQPQGDSWADLRGAQADAVRTIRNSGFVGTVDTGEPDNLHPTNKRPIGERLALSALAGHYRRNVVASGPTLRFVERRPGALALHFDHADGGLQVRGETLGEFAIAGADRVWSWAQASVESPDVVVVAATNVPQPVFVRYAWQGNPLATLFNAAGLPAVPFRTDED